MDIYPNPSSGSFYLDFEAWSFSELKLTLFNMQGQKVQQLRNEWTSAGKQTFQFGLQKMPAGIYMVNIRAGKYKVMKRLVLMD